MFIFLLIILIMYTIQSIIVFKTIVIEGGLGSSPRILFKNR